MQLILRYFYQIALLKRNFLLNYRGKENRKAMTETSRRAKAFHRESGKGFCPGLKTDNGARVAKGRFFRCRIKR